MPETLQNDPLIRHSIAEGAKQYNKNVMNVTAYLPTSMPFDAISIILNKVGLYSNNTIEKKVCERTVEIIEEKERTSKDGPSGTNSPQP